MYPLFGLIIAGLFGLNIFATWRLIGYDGFEPGQKYLQAGLIWLVPLFFALIVIGMTNQGDDEPSGKYRDRNAGGMPDFNEIDVGSSSDAGGSSD
jgi:hypothetical protein